jgi:nucleoside-diphosphate-sugar epimerase
MRKENNMKIFVTGGTGFIGRHVVKELIKNQHEVLLLSRNSDKQSAYFIRGNLNSIEKWIGKVHKFKPDVVIHMAWEGIPDFGTSNSSYNKQLSINLFKHLSDLNLKKIIGFGTCWEYEGIKGKVKENAPLNAVSPFAASKNEIRIAGEKIFGGSKISFIWIRPFFIYGPGQRSESLMPYSCNQITYNRKVAMEDPYGENDYLYVEDFAKAISLIVSKEEKSSIYNLGSGKLISNKKILTIIAKYLHKKPILEKFDKKRSSELNVFWADISKMKKEFQWIPKTSIKKGIKKTINSLNKG